MSQSAQYNKPWKSFDELPTKKRTALIRECLKQRKPFAIHTYTEVFNSSLNKVYAQANTQTEN